jgi:putative membrane protein
MLAGFAMAEGIGHSLVHVFLPIAIGAIVILLAFSKVMERLLDRAHSRVYHFIIGLVIASTALIVIPLRHSAPGDDAIVYLGVSATQLIVAGLLFLAGLALGLWMSHLEGKYKDVPAET